MTRSVPFHKQLDPNKQAGQVVFSPPVPNTSFDREPYLKHSNAAPYEPRVEQTLNEYIARKTEESKKITFDEWWDQRFGIPFEDCDFNLNQDDLRSCWNAALTKGKL